jgi:hypothetical protein
MTPAVGQMKKDTKWPTAVTKAIQKGYKVAILLIAIATKWPFSNDTRRGDNGDNE